MSAELLRFRTCWRLQFIAQLIGAFDGVYDRAIGLRDLVAQSLRAPAVSSFFYPRPSRLSDRGPGFLPALVSRCFAPFPRHRDSLTKRATPDKHIRWLCQQKAGNSKSIFQPCDERRTLPLSRVKRTLKFRTKPGARQLHGIYDRNNRARFTEVAVLLNPQILEQRINVFSARFIPIIL
jgi:hypothetical protein